MALILCRADAGLRIDPRDAGLPAALSQSIVTPGSLTGASRLYCGMADLQPAARSLPDRSQPRAGLPPDLPMSEGVHPYLSLL